MKALYKLLLPLFFISITANLFSQEWVRLFEDQKVNFYDVQREFNKYWAGKTPERGQGWMIFKRWEYFMEPRVYPTGVRPDPAVTFKEIQKYKQTSHANISDMSNWVSMGPKSWLTVSYNPGIGRINCITAVPGSPLTIFAGAPSGGIWKSTNEGGNWVPLTDNLQVIGVSSIVIDPINPDTMYIATGDGDGGATYSIGVLKSTDGGLNWNTTGLSYQVSLGFRIYKLVMSPANHKVLIASSTFGIFRSTDAGESWNLIINNSIRDLEFNPSNPNIIYAAGTLFFKSTNGGVNFTNITAGLPASDVNRYAIGVSPAGPSYVYLLASASANSGFYGFYRSTNAGDSFNVTITSPNILGYSPDGSSSGGQGTYDLCVAVSPLNANEVYTGGINIWKSTNGGDNFICNTYWVYPSDPYGYVHADVHTIDFVNTMLFTGTDGGLFKSSNFGTNWIDISAGMSTTQFYRFGGTPQNPNYLIGGTQDNGMNLLNGGIWTHVLGADGMEGAVDPTNINTVYGCRQNGGLCRSDDGGNHFTSIVGNITGSGYWVTPYTLDPIDPQTIYAGYQDIWKSTTQGTNWVNISNMNLSSFRSLVVAKSNTKCIYAANVNTIYKTTDGGQNWLNITAGLPGSAMTYIDVHPYDQNKLWVTLSGYTEGQKIYYSSTGGNIWNNISGTLPNLPANCVTYLHPDRMFVGMDVGVYYRDITMTDWSPFMNNIPNVEVSEMEVNLPANKLRAATYGRGIWETKIPPVVGTTNSAGTIPKQFALYQNFPNPFNPETIIRYDIAAKGIVSLKIFDILGREIKTLINTEQNPGERSVIWNGENNNGTVVTSGVYIYVLESGDFRVAKKLVFLK